MSDKREVRLIDANALKTSFEEDGHLSNYIEEFIDNAHTIDVVPVVHAKWIKHYIKIGNSDWKYKCSMCGQFNKQYSPPYCPHCGAKMDGGKDDENA